jgi:hypothetical protein
LFGLGNSERERLFGDEGIEFMSSLSTQSMLKFNQFIADPNLPERELEMLKPLIEKILEKSQP